MTPRNRDGTFWERLLDRVLTVNGLFATLAAATICLGLWFAMRWGDDYCAKHLAKVDADIATSRAVAEAVTKLTKLQERMEIEVTAAHERQDDADRVQTQALLEILECIRKNEQSPRIGCGDASKS
jgi:hypothetical protein